MKPEGEAKRLSQGAGGGKPPHSSTLNLKAESSGGRRKRCSRLGVRIPSPSLPGPAAVRLSTGASGDPAPGPVGRHSRLRSATPLPPAGPRFGRYPRSEQASPNSLGRRGTMWKRGLKTRERRKAAGTAKKPAHLHYLPWRRAETAEPELGRTDTNCLPTARALNPEAPPPPTRNPAQSPCECLPIPHRR